MGDGELEVAHVIVVRAGEVGEVALTLAQSAAH
jgi:hypothetical protein